ncbi:MAG: helix-turn-helix domain-containing protein [Planctomycetes bacterium]|nr:helix-turn-helix domain-containing protein [Planctomycetota bacterium]
MKKKTTKVRMTNDAMVIIDRLTGNDPVRRAGIADQWINLEIAQLVYDVRKQAGLTQAQLARKVGTTQSVISRLEDSDYGAQSLTMLRRIARALELYLRISFQPLPKKKRKRA